MGGYITFYTTQMPNDFFLLRLFLLAIYNYL